MSWRDYDPSHDYYPCERCTVAACHEDWNVVVRMEEPPDGAVCVADRREAENWAAEEHERREEARKEAEWERWMRSAP